MSDVYHDESGRVLFLWPVKEVHNKQPPPLLCTVLPLYHSAHEFMVQRMQTCKLSLLLLVLLLLSGVGLAQDVCDSVEVVSREEWGAREPNGQTGMADGVGTQPTTTHSLIISLSS